MTTEAALTKLSFLLARKYDSKKIRELLQQNLHGELTVTSNQPRFSLRDSELLRAVAEALNISSSKVATVLTAILIDLNIQCVGSETVEADTLCSLDVCCSSWW